MATPERPTSIAKLGTAQPSAAFQAADVLYALEWATLAPGFGGWRVIVSDGPRTELVSVIPPGAEFPIFFITPDGEEAVIERQRPRVVGGGYETIGRFAGLRDAVLALCPLGDDEREELNIRMEAIYPRSLRGHRPKLIFKNDAQAGAADPPPANDLGPDTDDD